MLLYIFILFSTVTPRYLMVLFTSMLSMLLGASFILNMIILLFLLLISRSHSLLTAISVFRFSVPSSI